MSPLDGLEYVAFAVEASPAWQHLVHQPRHRRFGPGDATEHVMVGSGAGAVVGTAQLVAEQGDTLTILVSEGEAPMTLVITVLSPTVAEISATSGDNWIRGVASLLALPPDAHGH